MVKYVKEKSFFLLVTFIRIVNYFEIIKVAYIKNTDLLSLNYGKQSVKIIVIHYLVGNVNFGIK